MRDSKYFYWQNQYIQTGNLTAFKHMQRWWSTEFHTPEPPVGKHRRKLATSYYPLDWPL